MSDSRKTRDEPDARGQVATGEQATGGPTSADAAPAHRPAEAAAGASNGGGPNGSAGGAAGPGAGDRHGDGTGGENFGGEGARRSEGGPAPVSTDADRPAPGAPSDVPVAAVPDDGRHVESAPASGPAPGAGPAPVAEQASAAVPSPRPRTPPPAANGPVPEPGPAAAAPPPWNRAPGQDIRTEQIPVAVAPAPTLDGPTSFMEPAAGGPGPGGEQPWSAVRAVRNRPPRRAALQLKRLDPWSVLKLALVLAAVLFLIWLVAVGVLYGVLDGMGVWDRLNGTYSDLVSGDSPSGGALISAGRVFAIAAVVGAVNSLLFAVVMTVGAFVYNVSAELVGGIEVTLSERD